ncbi:hydratase [Thioclava sp. 15-R06ZXC-3]|uniref:Hydratase n=1 Tax=Thioclava arctica TaxID=3238301 RepID=A0ABV3TND2_9RHOB
MQSDMIESCAAQFAHAHLTGQIDALPLLPETAEDAFAIQSATIARLGVVGGWKHGLIGGRDLACAPILKAEVHHSGTLQPHLRGLRVEVETAFLLGKDIAPDATFKAIIDAIDDVHIAFECLRTRFVTPTGHTPLELMADRFTNHSIVIGDAIADWRNRDLAALAITTNFAPARTRAAPGMSLDQSVDFLGFLARRAAELGLPLSAGQYVITGARLGPIPLTTPGTFHAEINHARVEMTVTAA